MDLFSFRDVRYKNVLHVPELTVPAGKLIAVVGPSGGGKSTLLRLMNNLISQDSGDIRYKNAPIDDIDPIALRREVVLLPQTPVIFPGTVKYNLLMGLAFTGKAPAADERLESILAELGLEQELAAGTTTLSGGEKQRLALGRVLLMEPDALLLDEPTSALDSDTERLIMDQLIAYRRGQTKTIVAATHAETFAAQADLVFRIEKGKVVSAGSTP